MQATRRFRGIVAVGLCLAIVSTATAKYSGGTGEPNDPYQIATAADLIALGETPADYDKHFILTADIDLDPKLPGRKVFDKAVIAPDTKPDDLDLNFEGTPFTGVFDGKGHMVLNLTIIGKSYLGLLGQLDPDAEVRNLGGVDVNVVGSGSYVAGLAGSNGGHVTQCYSTGAVSGRASVGGLVGANRILSYGGGGIVSGCQSAAMTSGNTDVGGLVGWNVGRVTQCHSTGAVSGDHQVGGLVGTNLGRVTCCYSTNVVTALLDVGGLIGQNGAQYRRGVFSGQIAECYSTGAVHGTERVGGLTGGNGGPATHCYSTGTVRGTGQYVGGLVGCRSVEVKTPSGLVQVHGTATGCFWDIQTSGQATSDGGTGKTTAEMQDPNTAMAAGWDFVGQPDSPYDIWGEPEGGGYPVLSWQLPPGLGLPKFSGGDGRPTDPYLISRKEELSSICRNPRLMMCHFRLVDDLDLTGFPLRQIGDYDYPYAGVFDGDGHTISHLTTTLFGVLDSEAEVKNLGLVDVDISGLGSVGGLVGSNEGRVTQCYSTGRVSGQGAVGGLVGSNHNGSVTHCYSTVAVSGEDFVGGLVGDNNFGSIATSSSTGTVTGSWFIGGLVGTNYGSITTSYSTGAASGTDTVGGLVGWNVGDVTQCYSTSSASGSGPHVGGLMGGNAGNVTRCYSTGAVSGSQYVGGLVGYNSGGTVTGSFWDTQTSGQATSAGGTGKTTTEMQTAKTFLDAGWDFVGETANGTEDIWWILEGKDYPRLWWELPAK